MPSDGRSGRQPSPTLPPPRTTTVPEPGPDPRPRQRAQATRQAVHTQSLALSPGAARLPRRAPPSRLLVARYGVVPFAHREALLRQLDAWVEDGAPVGVQLIVGPGGMGKTRLAQEWTRRWRARGWQAGFVEGALDPQRAAGLGAAAQAIVIIDYAETREGLGELLRHAAMHAAEPKGELRQQLRVVLLCRGQGDWWRALSDLGHGVQDLLDDGPEPVALEPIALDVPGRRAEFSRAAQALAERRGAPVPVELPDLSDARYQRVLYLHMAALAAVEGLEIRADQLLAELIKHEESYWLKRAELETADVREREDFKRETRTALAALTLLGGAASREELDALMERLELRWALQASWVLQQVYPGLPPLQVAPLEPDLLGEALTRRVMEEVDDAEVFLRRTLIGVRPEQVLLAFVVLARMEISSASTLARRVVALLAADLPALAFPAFVACMAAGVQRADPWLGRALGEALAQQGTLDVARLLLLVLPDPQQTLGLREVCVWCYGTMLSDPALHEDPMERATLLNNYAVALSGVGRGEEALQASRQAAAIRQGIAAEQGELDPALMVSSLNNTAADLMDAGQVEEAVASVQRAVDILRAQLRLGQAAFQPKLATTLANLSAALGRAGRLAEALPVSDEAISLARQLASERDFERELSDALHNRAVIMAELGRPEEAVVLNEEVVALRRRVAQRNADQGLPALASSLSALGADLHRVGRNREAREVTGEAVALYRRLAQGRPARFAQGLIEALVNLGVISGALGERGAAAGYYQEASALRRRGAGS